MCEWIYYFAVRAKLIRGIKRETWLTELRVRLGEPVDCANQQEGQRSLYRLRQRRFKEPVVCIKLSPRTMPFGAC